MKHLLSINDLTRSEAIQVLDTAQELARVSDAPMKKLPTLRGRTIVNLFFEDSTRTRISFEAAAKRLSADVINFSAKGSSVSKGESLKDTAQTLQAMGADAVVIRHSASGAAKRLADSEWTAGAVVNAGDGTHEHPSQALLDSFTIRKHLAHGGKDLAGLKVAIVGDIRHSRVALSNIYCLQKMGAEVLLVGPPTLIPKYISSLGVQVSHNVKEALQWCHVANILRIQLERQNIKYFPSLREYSLHFGVNRKLLDNLNKEILIMHPGPINRGVEISSEVADGENSIILNQVENGVAIRMAIIYLLASQIER